MNGWGFRVARAATFAVVCVLLAALGHVVMSGMAVPVWALMMTFGWIGLTAWIVADRERSVPFVVVATLVAQGGLHVIFTLAQSMTMPHAMSGTSSYGMFAAHLLAALLCGLWLAYGERAAFTVLRSLATRVLLAVRLLVRPQPIAHQRRIRPAHSPAPFREFLLVHAITSRGPPRGVAVR
jgi:hypothetical protein